MFFDNDKLLLRNPSDREVVVVAEVKTSEGRIA